MFGDRDLFSFKLKISILWPWGIFTSILGLMYIREIALT